MLMGRSNFSPPSILRIAPSIVATKRVFDQPSCFLTNACSSDRICKLHQTRDNNIIIQRKNQNIWNPTAISEAAALSGTQR